jgi:hypothetical protein
MVERFGTAEVYDNLGKALTVSDEQLAIAEKTLVLQIVRQLSSFPSQRKILRNSHILPLICKFMNKKEHFVHGEIMANSFRTIYYLMKDDGMAGAQKWEMFLFLVFWFVVTDRCLFFYSFFLSSLRLLSHFAEKITNLVVLNGLCDSVRLALEHPSSRPYLQEGLEAFVQLSVSGMLVFIFSCVLFGKFVVWFSLAWFGSVDCFD